MTDVGHDLAGDAPLRPDICIVGAGPAGLAVAHGLKGRGLRVLVLAGGGTRATIRGQDSYWGRQTGAPNEPLTHARFRMLGGSGTRWAGLCRRLDATDLAAKPGLPWTGWPIGRADLDPWYDEAERLLQVDGPGQDAAAWTDRLSPMDRLAGDDLALEVLRFARRHDLSADLSDLRHDPDLRILVGASAARLAPRDEGAALDVRLASGRTARVAPRALVLACGAVETARLLLASGRGGPMAGRCFLDHLYLWAGHVDGADAAALAPVTVSRFGAQADERGGFALWRVRRAPTTEPGAAAFLIPRHGFQRHPDYEAAGGRAVRHLAELARGERFASRDTPGALLALLRPAALRSAARHARELRRPDLRPALRVQVESLPDPDSRITLAPGAGPLPRVRAHWRVGAAEREAVETLRAAIARHLDRAGLGRLVTAEGGGWGSQTGGKHHMGGARMSDDPRRGVVDADLAVHGEPGLFVAGSAVFPTGGWANPTLTIVALSLRLAAHVAVRARDGAI